MGGGFHAEVVHFNHRAYASAPDPELGKIDNTAGMPEADAMFTGAG